MEEDNEIKNIKGSSLDFDARIYDSRLGRPFSIDRFARFSPYQSGYAWAGNNPIVYTDKGGYYRLTPQQQRENPVLTNVLKNLQAIAQSNPVVWAEFKNTLGLTEAQAIELVKWDSGPDVVIETITDRRGFTYGYTLGTTVTFNKTIIDVLEGRTSSHSGLTFSQVATITSITALHELQHFAEFNYRGIPFFKRFGERGNRFERNAFGKVTDHMNIKTFNMPDFTTAVDDAVAPMKTFESIKPQLIPQNDQLPEIEMKIKPVSPVSSEPNSPKIIFAPSKPKD